MSTKETVFGLNPEQKKAFNRFKRAYADMKKLGVLLVNNYGYIEAYNNKFINGYTDAIIQSKISEDKTYIKTNSTESENYFYDGALISWADDTHYIELTPAGKKLYENEQ